VAPQWLGKPPRKPLTPEQAFVMDRRARLLEANPDLRLLTCEPCGLASTDWSQLERLMLLHHVLTGDGVSAAAPLPLAEQACFCVVQTQSR
jgi:hypothetical protein